MTTKPLGEKPWRLVPMTEFDLPEVLAIEVRAQPTPWTEVVFMNEMALDWSHLDVLRDAHGKMLGYIDCWFIHDELHVLNVVVSPEARRLGCAHHMMTEAFALARQRGSLYVTLEVRIHNTGAIKLYEALKFDVIGKRPGYYADTGEAALIMARLLPPWGVEEPT
jgi:ribosomal-protein-alanine N-acetyltransferase